MKFTRAMVAISVVVATSQASAASDKEKATPKKADKPAAAAPAEKGRDWSAIDTNKDGFISPEEMDAWLKANPGPQK